jgi:MFS family permease
LVSELIPKEKRGVATSLVAGVGLTGAVVAYFISQQFDWRVCYYIGGGLGLSLLLLRISVFESGMFTQIKNEAVSKGNFFMFFTNGKRFKKYLLSILIGLPTWYVIGILVTFSKEFGEHFNLDEPIKPGKGIMLAYVAISIGDILIGLVSQALRSRKKALFIFYGLTDYNRHCTVLSSTGRYCGQYVSYLCFLRFWYRLLGDICYDGCGTFRNQFTGNGSYYRS